MISHDLAAAISKEVRIIQTSEQLLPLSGWKRLQWISLSIMLKQMKTFNHVKKQIPTLLCFITDLRDVTTHHIFLNVLRIYNFWGALTFLFVDIPVNVRDTSPDAQT